MIYIALNSLGDVTIQHHMPFDETNGMGKTKEELEVDGFFVETIPMPEKRNGKDAILKGDVATKTVWYEYVDRVLTRDEQIEALKAENQALNTAVVELYEIVLGGI